MALLAFILRVILFLFVFRLAAIVLRALFGGFAQGLRPRSRQPPSGAAPPPGRIEELVKDPICGLHIARSTAIAGRHGGEPAWFCSQECADKSQT